MGKPYLSVIIPAYNEAKNIRSGSLEEVKSYLEKKSFSWEIVIVNDGSSDETRSLLDSVTNKTKNVRVIHNPHQGKAATVITGVMEAAGEIILFTDMDQATPISEFDKFISNFDKYDIVIGSRSGRKGAPLIRKLLAVGMVVVRSIILRLPYRDTQCGFKAFKSSAGKKVFNAMSEIHPPHPINGPAVNAGFDVELLYIARKQGAKILEVPVTWQYRESKRVSFFKDTINSLRELILVRIRSMSGAYTKYYS